MHASQFSIHLYIWDLVYLSFLIININILKLLMILLNFYISFHKQVFIEIITYSYISYNMIYEFQHIW